MATAAQNARPRFREPPDTFFAFVAGLYVAVLVTPAVVAVLATTVTTDSGLLYLSFLAVLTGLTAGGTWVAARWRGVAERTGRTGLRWLFEVVAVAFAGGYLLVGMRRGDAAGVAGIGGFFTALFGVILGFGLTVMSRNRYVKAVVDEDAVAATWRAGWPKRRRRAAQAIGLVFMLGYMGGSLADLAFGTDWLQPLGTGLLAVGVSVINLGQERTYRTTPFGLETKLPMYRNVYDWDGFESFEVHERAILLHRRSPWRPVVRCARADLDDEAAVVDALEEYLPRAE